jgi:hypothetical protein
MSRWFVLIAAFGVLSCSGKESAPAPVVVAETDTGSIEDVAVEETPEVCGVKVGDTFCDYELMGYARTGETTGLASATPYGAYKLTDVLAKSSVKYVYVYASAYW